MDKNVLQWIAILQLQGKNNHQDDLMKIMAGDTKMIEKWSSPLSADERNSRNSTIFDHWLAGETTTEIAKDLLLTRQLIDGVVENAKAIKRKALLHNESTPIYNVWNYANCDKRFGQKHPGQIPGQAIINLLLWLTKPFDIVVDPMAGGGTTIDVCKYLLRRYHCFDIDPKRPDIYQLLFLSAENPGPLYTGLMLLHRTSSLYSWHLRSVPG